MNKQSKNNFVRIAVEIKHWMRGAPPIDAARPAHCPACGSASRRVGGKIVLHGHGVRERVSPWRVVGALNAERWVTLVRWARAVRARKLFVRVRACPGHFTLRQVAERAAMTLASQCPSRYATAPPDERSFYGAALGL